MAKSEGGHATETSGLSFTLRPSMDSPEHTLIRTDTRPLLPARAPSAPQAAVAGYEILSELGRGGMGIVFKARQKALDRLVALKMILTRSGSREEDIARFRAEAEIIARLDHPNLVAVHEVGEWPEADGRHVPFLVMEYVGGGTLEQHLAGKPQPPRQAAQTIRTLARALHVVHQRGVVHRDLKPANILLTDDGTPKITDFGLAKRLEHDSGLTQTGALLGTPAYMAPEQAAGRAHEVGTAADIHALGAILYQMLTGQPPYLGNTAWQTVEKVLHADAVPPRRLRPEVPRDLETICLKCLHKDPARRYLDARALADDLDRFLEGRPIEARPTPALERLAMWARRQPAVAFLLAVCLISLLLLIVSAVNYQRRLHAALLDAHRHAEQSRQRLEMLNVGQGVRALDEGNACTALVWFVAALGLNRDEQETAHRIRIGTVLRTIPPVRHIHFHRGPARLARFSKDGRCLLTAGDGGMARVWDVASGQPVSPALEHPSAIQQGTFDEENRRIVLGCRDGRVVFHDLRDRRRWEWPARHGSAVTRLVLASGQLLSASEDGTARLAPADGSAPGRIVARHPMAILSADLTPDGKRLATASADRTARLWHADGRPASLPLPHPEAVLDLRFQPGGKRLATACADGAARLWSSAGVLLHTLRHRAAVLTVRFNEDGTRLVTASDDHSARVWDTQTGEMVIPPLLHRSGVNQARFSGDGTCLVTASDDNTARVWSAATGEPLTPLLRHAGTVHRASFHPEGRLVATASNDTTIRLWELLPAEALPAVPAPPPSAPAANAPGQWPTPDGRSVLAAEGDHGARLRDARTGTARGPVLGHGSAVVHASFTADGLRVVTASDDNMARLWDPATGELLCRPLPHSGTVRHACFSPDGRMILTAAADNTLRVWDARCGEPLSPQWPISASVRTSAFSAAADRLSVYLTDGSVRTFDLRPDTRAVADLERLAQILSSRHLDPMQGLVPLGMERLRQLWREPKAGGSP